jgi:hypothetical protein
MKFILAAALIIIVFVASCETAEKTKSLKSKHQIMVDQSKLAIQELKLNLMSELGKAMVESDEKAVEVCSDKALSLTKVDKNKHPLILDIGRSSLKIRNTKNAPYIDLQNIMDKMVESRADDPYKNQLVQIKGESNWYYIEPIYISEMCLKCHGDDSQRSQKVTELLDQRYVQDQARDYKLGDFRGVFWVKIKEPSL